MSHALELGFHCNRSETTEQNGYRVFTAQAEIDEFSIKYARKNVLDNGLQDRISVAVAHPQGQIFSPLFERCDERRL